jgi:hypothetical protein
MALGNHRLEHEVVEGWGRLPEGWAFTEVVGVGVDSRERVFVFCRGPHPVIVFDKDGRFVDACGAGRFVRPHGIFIGPDDRVFLTKRPRATMDARERLVACWSMSGRRRQPSSGAASRWPISSSSTCGGGSTCNS